MKMKVKIRSLKNSKKNKKPEKDKEQKKVCENIYYDNYCLDRREKIKYYLISCAGIFATGYVFYKSIPFSLAICLLSVPLKKQYIIYKIKDRRQRLRSQFRDLLYSLSASVSAGRQMGEALQEAYGNLRHMYGEEEPVMKELRYMVSSMNESRTTEEKLLKDFAGRSGIKEIISFADVYITCRSTGADVSEMIGQASTVLMDKMTIEREIKAITSQKRGEAKIISSMPVILIVFLNITSPSYLEVLYSTVAGRLIMTAALGIIIISYYIMNKMSEVYI